MKHQRASTAPHWILAAVIGYLTVAILAALGVAATADAAPPSTVWQTGRTSPYAIGETFRSGQLGYTVHGLSTRAGYAAVEIRVHNPHRDAQPFEASWVRVETSDQLAYGPDVFASLRVNDGRPAAAGARLHPGASTRLLLFFTVPGNATVRRVLVADPARPGEFAGAALLCLDNDTSPSRGDRT